MKRIYNRLPGSTSSSSCVWLESSLEISSSGGCSLPNILNIFPMSVSSTSYSPYRYKSGGGDLGFPPNPQNLVIPTIHFDNKNISLKLKYP